MEDFEKLGLFYLGRRYDPVARRPLDSLLLYPSKNLTTHAVCIGMTGSGKTGLCLSLVEEAAIDQIPVIAIDPKGDLANLLLNFPALTADALAPWLEPGVDAAAEARRWADGLAASGQDPSRIARLRDSAEFSIYTPGSTAGIPLSIVRSLAAPPAAILGEADLLRDRVLTTVSSLLTLAGIDAEPLQSREHILISALTERTWRAGADLDLAGLIQQLQTPPMTRVGALDLESFFPAKERFALALKLNNLLASPSFAAWLEGEPLDVQRLLYTADGKPRVSIISIAHLGDQERMFVTALVLDAVLGWARAQSGTSSLRAILYMDEIAGYMPPVAMPPSKRPLLTLLKQARAFGLGVVLATQNPVDLDYKGLANAGTWFIGRLQTERDKQRVLEGLEGATSTAGRPFDRAGMEQTLAGLGNRVFLMNDVREDAPVAFQTRWTLSYLRGPMSRDEVRRLMADRRRAVPAAATPSAASPSAADGGERPILPASIRQHFAPVSGAGAAVYAPYLLAQAAVRFFDAKLGLDQRVDGAMVVPFADGPIPLDWAAADELTLRLDQLADAPAAGARFVAPPPDAAQPKSYARWTKELTAWLQTHQQMTLWRSPSTGETSRPGEREGDFRARLAHESREDRDRDVTKLRARYAPKVAALEERIRRATQAAEREADEARSAQLDTALTVGAGLLGAMLGGRRSRSILAGARGAGRAVKQTRDVTRARETVAALQAQLQQLQAQLDADVADLAAARDPQTELLDEVIVRPKKTDVQVKYVALLWKPR